jgi:hypothetical protein
MTLLWQAPETKFAEVFCEAFLILNQDFAKPFGTYSISGFF